MPFELSPDVIYRIQNVLYPASYLSAGFEPTLHDGTEVVCMPDDNTDNKQQWRFNRDPKSGYYDIQSVHNERYLSFTSTAVIGVFTSAATTKTQWIHWIVNPNDFGATTLALAANTGSNFVGLQVAYHGNTNASLVPNLATDACSLGWILRPLGTPTSPPAPRGPATGNYRIRSYNNNQCLLTMSLADDAKCYVTQQLPGDKIQQQTWSVTRNEETGLYTIQNHARTTHFLASYSGTESDGSRVIGQATPYSWVVQKSEISPLLIGLTEPRLSIGFADYKADNFDTARLKPTDTSAPSQMWLFETARPIGTDEVHASREFEPGDYYIQNAHDKIYLEIKDNGDVRGTDSQPLPASAKFTLAYIDNSSPIFTLRNARLNRWLLYNEGILESHRRPRQANQWIALPYYRHSGSRAKPVYYICHPAQEHPLSAPVEALSGRLEDGDFVFDERKDGQVLQMWDFEEASPAKMPQNTTTTQNPL